jgi:alpha-L-rhamnosidase
VGGAAGGLSTVSQGRHAGRRLLLAAPVSGDGAAVAAGVDGLSIRLDAGAYVVLDLGRTVHGRLVATARADQRGVLDAGWSERLLNGRPLPHPGSLQPEWSQVDSWILSADQAASVTTIDARAGRYLLLAAWEGAVQLEALAVEEETYLTEPIGRFTSSDPLLDRIWRTGADTLRVNMTDGYADPWRERGQWWGDAYVAIQVNRAVYGDAFLWRRGLEAMARAHTDGRPPAAAPSPPADTVLLDYGLLWLISMQEYRQATGDSSLAVGYQDVVADALRYYATWEAPDSGLLELPPGPWQSKALVDWAGQFDREGEITALNAQYSAALDAAASLAYATGQDALVRQRRGRAGEVRRAIVDRLWDPAGRFFYTARVSDDFVPPWPHAQAWALAYQVPYDPDRAATADALLNLVSRDPAHANVEIYGFQWLLEGLAADDRLAEAADLVRTHYGAVLDAGHTTWPEVFDPSPRWSWSLSHAWGASPTWFLTTHVLGARQQGSRSWWIQPAFDVVSHAEGVLPLIANMPGRDLSPASNAPAHSPPDLLTVSWTGGRCSARTLSYEAPARTIGAIALISASRSTVTLDGQEVWAGGAALVPGAWAGSGSSVILNGREGAHTVGVSAPEGGCP